jgi:AcrR family transcriptional regulator
MDPKGPPAGPDPQPRESYRHGDLERALVGAGFELARVGGPQAVVLREATRRVGVSPNAAYRHFTDRAALLAAVCDMALAALAVAIEDAQAGVAPSDDRGEVARRRFLAVGTGYVSFARQEPGLFRTAFSVPESLDDSDSPTRAGRTGRSPFRLLCAALDDMVDARALAPASRPGAELLAWSAVHGLAMLLIDGPLRAVDDATADAVTQRLVEMVDRGIAAGQNPVDG